MLDGIEKEGLSRFDKVALAVSGGKDSMSLLHFYLNNFARGSFYVITVHHNLRGKEGERDRDFVMNFCKDNGVECVVFEENIPAFCEEHGYTVEQGARIRRRQIFAETVKTGKAQRVVTAHHCDDQIESILMHVFRGSGIRGLRGMDFDDGVLLRPYLRVTRKQIDEYVGYYKVPYVEDSSNFCVDYTRNKVRREIIPLIAKAYPNFENNVLRLGERAREIFGYIDNASKDFEKREGTVFIPDRVFKRDKVVASQTVINAVDEITTRVDLTAKHIDGILSLTDKAAGASASLPFGLTAYREVGGITLALGEKKEYSGEITGYGEYCLGDKTLVISPDEISGALRCDLDKISGAQIRNRLDGDSFRRYKGANKSLGDYFTDIKLARRLRDNVIVVAKGQTVLLLPEYEISDEIKIDDHTARTAYVKVRKTLSEE